MTASNYMPDVVVEVAFDAGWSTAAASRTWTDVSAYVELDAGISIARGRQDERASVDASTLTLTLDNSDGRFTAGLTTGAYYPNVRIGRPIRVTSTPKNGTASVRFTGYVDEWPVEWDGTDSYATATISATSRMARLGQTAPLASLVQLDFVEALGPVGYWPLVAGGIDNQSVDPGSSGLGALTTKGTGAAIAYGDDGATFAGGKYLSHSQWEDGGDRPAFFGAFIADSAAHGSFIMGSRTDVPGGNSVSRLAVNSSGLLEVTIRTTGGIGDDTDTGATVVTDGALHTFMLHRDALYLDGVLEFADGMGAQANPFLLGRAWDINLALEVGFKGTLAHFGILMYAAGSAPDATEAAIYDEALRGMHSGETAEARAERIATYAGIPAAEVSVSPDADTPMSALDTDGQSSLSLLQSVVETDGGVLYDARDGTLTYVDRHDRYTAATALTLNMATQQVEADVKPKVDRSALINKVEATVTGTETTVTALDQGSVDDYGLHGDQISLDTTDANEAHAAAWWRVNTYGEPRARIPQLTVSLPTLAPDPPTVPTLVNSILAADIGSRIAVTGWPAQVGSTFADGFFVEGYAETIGPESYQIAFNVSPATGFDVWTVEDAVFGQYDAYPIAY